MTPAGAPPAASRAEMCPRRSHPLIAWPTAPFSRYNVVEAAQHFEYKMSHVLDKGARRTSVECAVLTACVRHGIRVWLYIGAPGGVFRVPVVGDSRRCVPGVAADDEPAPRTRAEPLNQYFMVEENSVVSSVAGAGVAR